MSILLAFAAAGIAGAQEAPPPATPSKLFEAGHYEDAAGQVKQRLGEGDVAAEDIFWAAQSLSRLGRHGESAELYGRLGGEGDDDPWRLVGRSGVALELGNRAEALQLAQRAAEAAQDMFFAHYQLGVVHHQAQQWGQAAASFDRAAQIDDSAAYAHYFAGVAYNRLKRIDPMVVHFRQFLDLAPSAPERASVEQILKLVAGLR
jgi:tetratricopeptide (TPR) repeat protein